MFIFENCSSHEFGSTRRHNAAVRREMMFYFSTIYTPNVAEVCVSAEQISAAWHKGALFPQGFQRLWTFISK